MESATQGALAPCPEFTVVTVDDWAALYRDGAIVAQGYSIEPRDLCEESAGQPFKLEVIAADGTRVQRLANESGQLPATLAEVRAQLAEEPKRRRA